MAARAQVPKVFAHLVDLAAEITGGFVLYATDDYFAEKENLLKVHAPEWIEGKYTDKGKWMDGWESQRRRTPGHDFAILRLGTAGLVHGALVDTTHFKGNAPAQVSLEGIAAPWTSTAEELRDAEGWIPLFDLTAVKADFPNLLKRRAASKRVTHVRLRIFPDGGVARLRVYGEVVPEVGTFWRQGSVDLAAVENGGTLAEVSDQFFGSPANLLLPGRGVHIGDGWETKRRRTPGSDWAVIRLGRRGIVDRIELDTHCFKGNAPQACRVDALDAIAISARNLRGLLRAPKGWMTLIEEQPLVQHRRHQLDPSRRLTATHLRVHIFPHGGVNRIRFFGHALDTPRESAALASLSPRLLQSFCGSSSWVRALTDQPPESVREFLSVAEKVWFSLLVEDWLEAFAAHPRIGQTEASKSATVQSSAWSKAEQNEVAAGEAEVKRQLKELNDAYFQKFGFIYIVCAADKNANQLLEILKQRIGGNKKSELETAAREQAKITRLRIIRWLVTNGG